MPGDTPQSIENLIDPGSFAPSGQAIPFVDPLGYPGYGESFERARRRTGVAEAVTAGAATIGGIAVEVAAFEFSFMGGSMGSGVGEILARAMERSVERDVPFVLRTATGGARMHEGMASLVQMPKLVTARLALGGAHLPFVAVLGHPTTGGVLASVGALADFILAETGATVGFAGPRIVEPATGRPLSAGSHTAASALAAGLVDAVVDPEDERGDVSTILGTMNPSEPQSVPEDPRGALAVESPDPWESLQAIRGPDWPRGPALARAAADTFFELRGDRAGTDDRGCVAALAAIAATPCVVLALDHERAPAPGAYRKALRCLTIAERLRLPVVTLVDTPGADPSEDSEAGGIAWAIAALFEAMLCAPVPILTLVTGEAGSGGALAFATADTLLVHEESVFSVIAPELAAEILWRDGRRAPDAARRLKMGAASLLDLGIADGVLPGRPSPESVRRAVAYHLAGMSPATAPDAARRRRWRSKLGH